MVRIQERKLRAQTLSQAAAFLFFGICYFTSAQAQETSSVKLNFEQSQYLSSAANTSDQTTMRSLRLDVEHEAGKTWKKKLDFLGELSFSESDKPYVAVPELYLYKPPQSSSLLLSLGRQKRTWSRMDEYWKLGLWQPLARWDYFRPESQGLTGLGVGAASRVAGFEFFASPLFIPDQGPNFRIEEGEFKSENRWFWRPQTEVGIFSAEKPIHYHLNKPSEEEVFLQSTYAARLWAGRSREGSWMSAAYAYKPINQYHLAVDADLILGADESRIEAEIYPVVVKHHLATLEGGWGSEDLIAGLSVAQEWPEKPDFPQHYMQSPLYESVFASSFLEHRLPLGSLRDTKLIWSYLKTWRVGKPQHQALISSEVQSSYSRFPIEEVIAVEWVATLMNKSTSALKSQIKYWYSLPDQGSWLSAGVDWKTGPDWLWHLKIDVLGSAQGADRGTSNLMSRYRTNDRIIGGIQYVF